MLHAFAFISWDIGTRDPAKLAADVRDGFRSARILTKGLWRFFLGSVLLLAGALDILRLTVVDIRTEFLTLETLAIVAGLAIEMLVGEPIRRGLSPH